MPDTSHSGAFPSTVHHPSSSSLKVASQAADDLAPKSPFSICFPPILEPTVGIWILHGANYEMKTSL